MSALRNRSLLATVPVLLAAGACGDPLGPGDPDAVAFRYEGALEGRFAAPADTPSVSVEGVPIFGEWALAAAGDSLGGVVIGAFRTSGEERGDLFVLQLVSLRTGDFDCAPGTECHGRVLFGIADQGGLPVGPAERYFEIVSGEIRVTTAGPDRISGSFSFVARDEGGAGAATLTVEDGTFDLPFARLALGQTVLCFGGQATGGSC